MCEMYCSVFPRDISITLLTQAQVVFFSEACVYSTVPSSVLCCCPLCHNSALTCAVRCVSRQDGGDGGGSAGPGLPAAAEQGHTGVSGGVHPQAGHGPWGDAEEVRRRSLKNHTQLPLLERSLVFFFVLFCYCFNCFEKQITSTWDVLTFTSKKQCAAHVRKIHPIGRYIQ